MSRFKTGYRKIRLFEQSTSGGGLYKNQIGAIGAALSHFSIKNEAALITMPTGTGKTAVMVILSYLLKANKVLVITPSVLVREQITKNFSNPSLLLAQGIIPNTHDLPRVYELKGVVDEKKEWDRILKFNDVIVAIPGTLDKISNLSSVISSDAFDLMFIDEAHHSRANSWKNLLATFSSAKQILMTATPFRRDKKDIKARLVYNYPLSQAYNDGLFSKIDFIPVKTELFASAKEKNVAIAKRAEEAYLSRKHSDHKIIIRTDRKSDADELSEIYTRHTSLKLLVVHSKLTAKVIKQRIDQLADGSIDGIICVDMMGEGYDFPALKIAAVHIPHKSLAITLQFVGRISRTNTLEGSVATLIAGEHEFKIDSHQLYKTDSEEWSVILPDLHKSKIQKTEDEQEFFDSFENRTEETKMPDIQYEEALILEDDDFRPFFHAKVYNVIQATSASVLSREDRSIGIDIEKVIDFSGTDILAKPIIRHHHVSHEHKVAVYVVSELSLPGWYIKDDGLNDVKNELFVIYFDEDNSLLFIGATLKETELYEHITNQYLAPGAIHEMVPLPLLKRAMAGWHDTKMYNVGMKSRKTKGNSEAYKQVLGSLAQKAVLPSDKYSYTRGHSFGGAFDSVLKKNVLLGVSTSSKVWSLQDDKIKYFVEWCQSLARKVGDPEMDNLEGPLSELDCGKVVDSFPNEKIFFADWDSKQYHQLTTIAFIDHDKDLIDTALLCSCSIAVDQQTSDTITLSISKGLGLCKVTYSLLPKCKFEYDKHSLHKIAIRRGSTLSNTENFLSILNEAPINLYFENLSKLVGRVIFSFDSNNLKTISSKQIKFHPWPSTVNVQKEFYTEDDILVNNTAKDTRLSIHDYIVEVAKSEFEVVFYDHGALEIADVIGFKKGKVQFWHCKKQTDESPRCSVDDIYEVCGQAVKSVHWAHRGLLIKQICDRADNNNSNAKLRKGTLEVIREILESFENPIIPVEITIVQPGLKTKNLHATQYAAFERVKLLLSGAESFLKDVSSCELTIMCS